jgi:hypothetical protein
MQLQYRGVQYQLNASSVMTILGEAIGKYRGAAFNTQYLVTPPVDQRPVTLKYRGVCYKASVDHS